MRLPAKYGSVYKLKGNRHRPWVARKTIGTNENGYPIYKYIAYTKTKAEALQALSEYNRAPYAGGSLTFEEAYRAMEKESEGKISYETLKHLRSAYKKAQMLYKMKMTQITVSDLRQACVEECKTASQIAIMKKMYAKVFRYAAENDVVPPERVGIVKALHIEPSSEGRKVVRKVFTPDEIEKLWEMDADIVLMLIYSGVRIMELLTLKKEDVHLEAQYFHIGRSKTEAGVRDVPIADKAIPLFERYMETESEYLVPFRGKPFIYQTFLYMKWEPWMNALGSKHTCHDTRHTCISMLTEAGTDKRVIQAIVGHRGAEITESVYTHISIDAKLEAINRI